MTVSEIYFNKDLHRYTDNYSNIYTSVTTLISEYENKFSDKEVDIAKACEAIGKNKNHPKYNKYKNKSYLEILNDWKKVRDEACDIGSKKHDYLEDIVKQSTGFTLYKNSNRLFTINELLDNLNLGKLNLDYFISTGLDKKYPLIFNNIKLFSEYGWNIYSEICTYNYDFLVSGLIDLLFVKNNKFVICDYKTNKNPLRFESGYYEKDNNNNVIGFIETDEYFKYPLDNLKHSVGNKYTLQLSLYAYLTELFGFKCEGLYLFHIMHDFYTLDDVYNGIDVNYIGLNKVSFYKINYLKKEVSDMLHDYSLNKFKNVTRK